MAETAPADAALLVVDDMQFSRQFITSVLQANGLRTVHQAETAAEALELLAQPDCRVDGVLTDLKMPGMHGLEFLKRVRTGDAGTARGLPVAMLTGYSEKALISLALALDADTFLAKPVAAEALMRHVGHMLAHGASQEWELKPVATYAAIDVDTAFQELVADKDPLGDSKQRNRGTRLEADHPLNAAEPEGPAVGVQITLHAAEEGQTLARDVASSRGVVLIRSGEALTGRALGRLHSLADIGEVGQTIWVLEGETSETS